MRAILITCILLCCQALSVVPAALACSGPDPSTRIHTDGEGNVAQGGSLLAEGAFSPSALALVDSKGGVHTGAWSRLGEGGEFIGRRMSYFRWVPDKPLAPGDYSLPAEGFRVSPGKDPMLVHVPAGPAEELVLAPSFALTARELLDGTSFECPVSSCRSALSTRVSVRPYVQAKVVDLPAAALPRLLARVVGESARGDIEGPWRSAAHLAVPSSEEEQGLAFLAPQTEYCVSLELFDAADGSQRKLGRTCLAHNLGELTARPAGYEARPCDSSIATEYARAWCQDNVKCESDKNEKCAQYLSVCGPDGEPLPGDGGIDAEPAARASGGCSAGGAGTYGAFWLVLLGVLAARKRARASDSAARRRRPA